MKNLIAVLLTILAFAPVQASELSIMSWDLNDFSDDRGELEIAHIANIIKDFDVVALQNVASGDEGILGIASLVKALRKKGIYCDSRISNPTKSTDNQQKCYAYLWKPSKITLLNDPWLDTDFENEICREPYLARFRVNGKEMLFINYFAHSHPDSSIKEINYFAQYPEMYPDDRIVITGNFNTDSNNPVFNPLKINGFMPNLEGLPTNLCEKCGQNSEYLKKASDFILFDRDVFRILRTGTSDFIRNCLLLPNAIKISNHIPVWVVLSV